MKNYVLTITLLTLSLFTTNAQKMEIIAGENNNSVHCFNIPDTTISASMNDDSTNFYLDLDSDGINDFHFNLYCYRGTGNGRSGITINPYRDNEVSYFRVDTQYVDTDNFICRNVANPFSNGEAISGLHSFDNVTTWLDGMGYGSFIFEEFSIYDWSAIGEKNIGLKMSINDTMVYAWIKVEVYFDNGVDCLTIKEYAYAKEKTTSILEANKKSSIKLYPNPVDNNLYIELPNYKAKINASIYDVNGAKVEAHSFRNKKNIHLKTDHLTKGIYILVIDKGNDVSYSKIVKK